MSVAHRLTEQQRSELIEAAAPGLPLVCGLGRLVVVGVDALLPDSLHGLLGWQWDGVPATEADQQEHQYQQQGSCYRGGQVVLDLGGVIETTGGCAVIAYFHLRMLLGKLLYLPSCQPCQPHAMAISVGDSIT